MPDSPLARPWTRRVAVYAAALAVRAAYLYGARGNPFFAAPAVDAATYDRLARQLAEGTPWEAAPFWQPPLYPYALGLVYRVVGPSPEGARAAQALLGALTCVLVAELAARRFAPRVAWLCGGVLAFYGLHVFFTGELLVPAISLPLDVAMLLALTPPAGQALTQARLVRAGLWLGLSAIARPTILLMLPSLVVWLLLRGRGGAWRVRMRRALVLVGATLVPIAPVTVRNVALGGAVLISTNGGLNLYLGNNPRYDETVRIRPGLAWDDLIREPGREGLGDAPPDAVDAYWRRRALAYFRNDPVGAAHLYAKKAWLLLQAYELPRNVDYNDFRERYAPALRWLIPFGLLGPLAIVGMWLTRRRPEQTIWRIHLAATTASVLLFFVCDRYRLSLVPLLAIYAAAAIDEALSRLATPATRRSAVAPLGAAIAVGACLHVDLLGVAVIDRADAEYLDGAARFNADDRPGAFAAFERALAHDPGHPDAHVQIARRLQDEGRCDLAIAHFEAALARVPRHAETWGELGVCLYTTGDGARALVSLERAAREYPHPSLAIFNLTVAYLQLGRTSEAARTVEAALSRAPNDELLLRARGLLPRQP